MSITELKKTNCDYCGLYFEKRRKTGQEYYFCSNECKGRALKLYPRKGKEYPCFWCEKKIYRTASGLKKSKHVFCSQACHYSWRKGKIIAPEETLFKKGQKPFNKGKNYEELYGDEKGQEMREINRKARLDNWKDLDYRKRQMKSRTPEKLKEFRRKGLEYSKSPENIKRLKVISTKKRVIDKIISKK